MWFSTCRRLGARDISEAADLGCLIGGEEGAEGEEGGEPATLADGRPRFFGTGLLSATSWACNSRAIFKRAHCEFIYAGPLLMRKMHIANRHALFTLTQKQTFARMEKKECPCAHNLEPGWGIITGDMHRYIQNHNLGQCH